MNTFLALLLIAAGWSLLLVAMNRHDGLGHSANSWAGPQRPPRSHVPDTFEPILRG